jgi:large subunit ribosomal protein L9
VKVVLRQDVESLGTKGDLLEVADGYARNYLVPRGLAIQATRGAVRQAESMRRSRSARATREREAAQSTADRLSALQLRIPVRAGEGGRLFGSVTNADIADAVVAHGFELERRTIELEEPIKELGTVDVPVRLHAEVTAVLHVEVHAE